VLALGLAAALVASALFNIGIALQGIEARSVPKKLGLRVSLLMTLFRRKRWVLGWVLGVVGIGPQLVALAYAPFVVVQPALASGLLILLFIGSRLFGERVTWLEIAGVCAIIGGLALVAWGAPSHT
jgi:drug/metabolite transporter (DMT)-like permease